MTKLPEKNKVTVILQRMGQDASAAGELKAYEREITIYFSDLEGSTAYFEKHGDATGLALVYSVSALQREKVEAHHGTIIKTIGDGVMAVFESTDAALRASAEVQREILRSRDSGLTMAAAKLRIGIHRGFCILKSDDAFGDAVNVAARVQSAGKSDHIVISNAALDNASDEFQKCMRSLGRFPLKGKSQEEELFDYCWQSMYPIGETKAMAAAAAAAASAPTSEFPPIYNDTPVTATIPVPTISIEVLDRAGQVQRHETFQRPTVSIGSAAVFSVPEDGSLAPVHAEVAISAEGLVVRDLTGTDTMVRLSAPYTLRDGDYVRFGQTTFRFELDAKSGRGKLFSADGMAELPDDSTFGRTGATFDLSHDSFVSRSHARIQRLAGRYVLSDLQSRNGTYVYVRGEQVVPSGSVIRVGQQLLRVAVE